MNESGRSDPPATRRTIAALRASKPTTSRATSRMNDIVPMSDPVTPSDVGQAQAEVPTESPVECPRTPSSSQPAADDLASRLARLDRVALLIGWGLPLLGLLAGTRMLLESTDHAASVPGGWLAGLLEAICTIGISVLAGLGVSSVLRVQVQWYSLHRQPLETESQSILGLLAERIDQLSEQLAETRTLSAPLPAASETTSTDWLREQSLAEIRRIIRAGKWDEATAILVGYSPAELADPRLSSLRKEIQSTREAARSERLAQLKAARQVSDPDRVLELHQSLIPLLDAETRVTLDSDLSQWFLRLIHNRLRTGKIQTELVVLAGRIAEAFSHTVEGASLRASLPTLRRSAGLCSRCGLPYSGIASACPACLVQTQASAGPPSSPTA
jgi:hypothetical protein